MSHTQSVRREIEAIDQAIADIRDLIAAQHRIGDKVIYINLADQSPGPDQSH